MMTVLKIGIFGCGNMGRALALGMRAQNLDAEFFLFTPTGVKAKELALEIFGTVIEKIEDMPKNLDWYLLGFKPQSLENFHYEFAHDAKIISILAGVNISNLYQQLKSEKIIRVMPNTPSALSEGANLYYVNGQISKSDENSFCSLFKSTGKLFKMNSESDLDLTTAFSGSGPALVFELARIFEEELTRMTEGRVNAKEIIAQTFLGSSMLMNSKVSSNQSFLELRNQVVSKKGVTYEALDVLWKNDLQLIFKDAFNAAYKRTVELSK